MGDFNLAEVGPRVILLYIPLLFSLCFHEFAHGWMAQKLGDNTAKLMGRLTMNPVAHMDVVGTLALPLLAIISGSGFLFGWAKPVPVNPRNLKDPTKEMFWIALAGPLSNILLAVIGGVVYFLTITVFKSASFAPHLVQMLQMFIFVNFLLAFFNMIPLHPLDGGKVLARFLPYNWNRTLEEHQMHSNVLLIVLFVSGGLRYLAIPVDFFSNLVIGAAQYFAFF